MKRDLEVAVATNNGDGKSAAEIDAQAVLAAEQAAEAADEQGLLFNDDVSPLPEDLGYFVRTRPRID